MVVEDQADRRARYAHRPPQPPEMLPELRPHRSRAADRNCRRAGYQSAQHGGRWTRLLVDGPRPLDGKPRPPERWAWAGH